MYIVLVELRLTTTSILRRLFCAPNELKVQSFPLGVFTWYRRNFHSGTRGGGCGGGGDVEASIWLVHYPSLIECKEIKRNWTSEHAIVSANQSKSIITRNRKCRLLSTTINFYRPSELSICNVLNKCKLIVDIDVYCSSGTPPNDHLDITTTFLCPERIESPVISFGGVYMIPARLSFRYEFTPVPSCGSIFVYTIPAQNLIPERVIPVRVHPGYCTGARFSLRYENSFRCHVKACSFRHEITLPGVWNG